MAQVCDMLGNHIARLIIIGPNGWNAHPLGMVPQQHRRRVLLGQKLVRVIGML